MSFARISHRRSQAELASRASTTAQLNGIGCGVGNLQDTDLPTPFRVVLDNVAQLLANLFDGHSVIDIKEYGAGQIVATVGPILKRMFEEVGKRKNHPAKIRETDDDVGAADFFDPPPFALDDNGVLELISKPPFRSVTRRKIENRMRWPMSARRVAPPRTMAGYAHTRQLVITFSMLVPSWATSRHCE